MITGSAQELQTPALSKPGRAQQPTQGTRSKASTVRKKATLFSLWTQARFFYPHDKRRFQSFFALNCVIMVVRLTISKVNTVYLVHSFVIFFDLLLANMFCPSVRLNVAMNILVCVCVTLYAVEPKVIWELLETTLMAVIASLYDLNKKHKKFKEQVHHKRATFSKPKGEQGRGAAQPVARRQLAQEDSWNDEYDTDDHDHEMPVPVPASDTNGEGLEMEQNGGEGGSSRAGMVLARHTVHRRRFKAMLREAMLENVEDMPPYFMVSEFLDGSSGIMYSSFIGLILAEFLHEFENTRDYLW